MTKTQSFSVWQPDERLVLETEETLLECVKDIRADASSVGDLLQAAGTMAMLGLESRVRELIDTAVLRPAVESFFQTTVWNLDAAASAIVTAVPKLTDGDDETLEVLEEEISSALAEREAFELIIHGASVLGLGEKDLPEALLDTVFDFDTVVELRARGKVGKRRARYLWAKPEFRSKLWRWSPLPG